MMEYKEYKVEIADPYWKKHFDALIKAGLPKSIAYESIRKADAERSSKVMYQ